MVRVDYDARWVGVHGIGRFAREVAARCRMRSCTLRGRPVDPWDPVRLALSLRTRQPTHFFSPGYNAPLGKPCPFSLTVHDLIHLQVPEERSVVKWAYYQWVVRPALCNAAVVFTGSEHARQGLAEWSGLAPDRIVVTGHGVGPAFSPNGSVWVHERPYFLYVGNQKPHKNVTGLVTAFAASGLAGDFDLLLTGDLSRPVAEAIGSTGLQGQVNALGLVPEAELPALYRGAQALVMPSRHEGFGLPLLEAMACGTPVLSSDRTSLPEVGGDAVRYFDPDDLESFVAGLRAMTADAEAALLRARGLERARRFNWDEVARRVEKAITATL